MVPIGTGKPGKREGIFQSGKSQGILLRLDKAGKFESEKVGTMYVAHALLCLRINVYSRTYFERHPYISNKKCRKRKGVAQSKSKIT